MNGGVVAAGNPDREILTPAALKTHPAFGAILDRAADQLVASYAGNRLLNRILNDRGRVVFCILVLYLDARAEADGGGLTVGRMVALCQETGVCSRGRARALMALMRWGGYLEAGDGAGDRRVKPLAPTAHMRTLFRDRWRAQYRVLEPVDPDARRIMDSLEDPAFFRRLSFLIGAEFRSGFRLLDGAPDLATAADRDGGMLVFAALFSAARAEVEAPTLADLARRFHISRAQVLQIVKEGVAQGLVLRGGEASAGRLTPRGEAAMTDFFAQVLWFFLTMGRRALAGG